MDFDWVVKTKIYTLLKIKALFKAPKYVEIKKKIK